jgi:hypothetical protein
MNHNGQWLQAIKGGVDMNMHHMSMAMFLMSMAGILYAGSISIQ